MLSLTLDCIGYLPAIVGLVPKQMAQAIRYYLDFCYLVQQNVIDDDDLEKLDELLAEFHGARKVFQEEGVWPKGFNLP